MVEINTKIHKDCQSTRMQSNVELLFYYTVSVNITKCVAETKIWILSVSYQSPPPDVVTTPFHSYSPSGRSHDPVLLLQSISSPLLTLRCAIYAKAILTPLSRVLLEKLTGSQLVKKFPAFYGTRRFVTTFTSARHLSLSWASSIHSMSTHLIFWRSILILSSHLRLSL